MPLLNGSATAAGASGIVKLAELLDDTDAGTTRLIGDFKALKTARSMNTDRVPFLRVGKFKGRHQYKQGSAFM